MGKTYVLCFAPASSRLLKILPLYQEITFNESLQLLKALLVFE